MVKKDKITAWFLLILLSLIWGSSYILIKIGLEAPNKISRIPPLQLGALRMIIASFVLLPFAFKSLKSFSRENILFLFISGLFGNGIPAFLYAYAETHLNSIITGMLNALVPVFTIIIAAIVFHFKIKSQHILGIIIGLAGAFLIVANKLFSIHFSKKDLVPLLVVLFATSCYAISLNIIKYKLKNLPPLTITSLSFLFVCPPSLLFLFTTNFFSETIHHHEFHLAISAVLTLAIIGTSLAVLLFNHLIKISSPVFASSVTYFIPVTVIVLGVLYGEKVDVYQLLGILTLITGVMIINKSHKK